MRAPNTFLVGAPKCGTTAMSAWLAERSDVFLPYPKEPWFWADDFRRTGAVVKLEGVEDYLGLYCGAAGRAVRLDASTVYLMSRRAIPRIVEFDPEARFIVMLRRPDLMAEAYHMEQVFNHVEDEPDFPRAWDLQAERAEGRRLPPLAAVRGRGRGAARGGRGVPIYLRSHRAVPEILAFEPGSRFIVMLRDPVQVAHALHMERRYAYKEDLDDFEEAWRAQADRAEGRRIPPGCADPALLDYRGTAMFGEQISRLFATVSRERVLVLFQPELQADPGAAYAAALAHLGLLHDGRTEFERVNAAHARRFPWLAKLVLAPPKPLEGPALRLRRFLIANRFGPVERMKRAFNRPQERRPLDPHFAEELRAEFAGDARLLAELLGRPIPWARAER